MPGNIAQKLEVYSYGFLQDVLTLLKILETDALDQPTLEAIIKERVERLKSPPKRVKVQRHKKEALKKILDKTKWGKRRP